KKNLTLTAPAEGIVATADPKALEGRMFEEGSTVIELFDPLRLRAEIRLPSDQPIARIDPKARVILRLHGWPERDIETAVLSIADRAAEPEDGDRALRVYTASISIPARISNLSAEARIYGRPCTLGQRWIVQPLTQLVRYRLWSLE